MCDAGAYKTGVGRVRGGRKWCAGGHLMGRSDFLGGEKETERT